MDVSIVCVILEAMNSEASVTMSMYAALSTSTHCTGGVVPVTATTTVLPMLLHVSAHSSFFCVFIILSFVLVSSWLGNRSESVIVYAIRNTEGLIRTCCMDVMLHLLNREFCVPALPSIVSFVYVVGVAVVVVVEVGNRMSNPVSSMAA